MLMIRLYGGHGKYLSLSVPFILTISSDNQQKHQIRKNEMKEMKIIQNKCDYIINTRMLKFINEIKTKKI